MLGICNSKNDAFRGANGCDCSAFGFLIGAMEDGDTTMNKMWTGTCMQLPKFVVGRGTGYRKYQSPSLFDIIYPNSDPTTVSLTLSSPPNQNE